MSNITVTDIYMFEAGQDDAFARMEIAVAEMLKFDAAAQGIFRMVLERAKAMPS